MTTRNQVQAAIAEHIAMDENYIWQCNPNNKQKQKQKHYMSRADAILNIVERSMYKFQWI